MLGRLPAATGVKAQPGLSRALARLLDAAEATAKDFDDDYTSTEHLLLALSQDRGGAGDVLRDHGVAGELLLDAVRQVRGSSRVTSQTPEGTYEALERYAVDLTAQAREGDLDPVIGRDEEIRRRHPGPVAPHEEQPRADR